jgi:hypothetical protein
MPGQLGFWPPVGNTPSLKRRDFMPARTPLEDSLLTEGVGDRDLIINRPRMPLRVRRIHSQPHTPESHLPSPSPSPAHHNPTFKGDVALHRASTPITPPAITILNNGLSTQYRRPESGQCEIRRELEAVTKKFESLNGIPTRLEALETTLGRQPNWGDLQDLHANFVTLSKKLDQFLDNQEAQQRLINTFQGHAHSYQQKFEELEDVLANQLERLEIRQRAA